uniref:Uncharacterized protein n=1 Tax=Anguilla anguilla TaxID=7936 RepID=A0A0E9RKT7_ANGAN
MKWPIIKNECKSISDAFSAFTWRKTAFESVNEKLLVVLLCQGKISHFSFN